MGLSPSVVRQTFDVNRITWKIIASHSKIYYSSNFDGRRMMLFENSKPSGVRPTWWRADGVRSFSFEWNILRFAFLKWNVNIEYFWLWCMLQVATTRTQCHKFDIYIMQIFELFIVSANGICCDWLHFANLTHQRNRKFIVRNAIIQTIIYWRSRNCWIICIQV